MRDEPVKSARAFEVLVLPHLDAAHNLARWLVRDAHAAQDIVQESFLRALRYFDSFRGEEARPWLLGIVRNSCMSWLMEQQRWPGKVELDAEMIDRLPQAPGSSGSDPLRALESRRIGVRIDAAIRALAPQFREVVVLREIEGLAYLEIADIVGIPVGTVMSRLSRARAELKQSLADFRRQE